MRSVGCRSLTRQGECSNRSSEHRGHGNVQVTLATQILLGGISTTSVVAGWQPRVITQSLGLKMPPETRVPLHLELTIDRDAESRARDFTAGRRVQHVWHMRGDEDLPGTQLFSVEPRGNGSASQLPLLVVLLTWRYRFLLLATCLVRLRLGNRVHLSRDQAGPRVRG